VKGEEEKEKGIPDCPGCRRLVERLDQLEARLRSLELENGRFRSENAVLRDLLEKARRAGKRQAAPFSKGEPKKEPKPPGRKPGDAHGPATFRAVPPRIDEEYDAPLPCRCPDCNGQLEEERIDFQYQTEIPQIEPTYRRFTVHIGRCKRCRRRVQGRHPLQRSDALGAAASQLGPNALALATHMNKALAVSCDKVRAFFSAAFKVVVSRSAICLAFQAVASKAAPTFRSLLIVVKKSPVVYADETGSKVNGILWWLWAFTTPTTTVYVQRHSRGADVVEEVLGADFGGALGHDGWRAYDVFEEAVHQQCLTHLIGRAKELLETATRGAVRFPRAVKGLLQDALNLRDRRDEGELTPHGLAVSRGRLEARLDRILDMNISNEDNRKFQAHLTKHRFHLFTFLRRRDVEPANWRGEQAMRPAVVFRKMAGSHRSELGAYTQDVLTSVLRTCRQRGADAIGLLRRMVCCPKALPFEIVPNLPGP
jgi:transposase